MTNAIKLLLQIQIGFLQLESTLGTVAASEKWETLTNEKFWLCKFVLKLTVAGIYKMSLK
jgi:hypothetical protein